MHLHLMPAGCALLTEAIFESLTVSDVAGKVQGGGGRLSENRTTGSRGCCERLAGGEHRRHRSEISSNTPVSGVRVQAFRTAPGGGSHDAVTDAAGKYSMALAGKAPAPTISQPKPILLARDMERNRAAFAELTPNSTNMDLHLQPGLVLSGKIQNRSGQPLSGAVVQIAMEQAGPSALSRITNGIQDEGAFIFQALPTGKSYRVQATSPGYERAMVAVPAEKTQTNRVELPPIMLRLANLQLAGQVVNLDSQPFAGAMVSIANTNQPSRPPVRTAAGGHFVINGLYEGPLNVRATYYRDLQ